MGKKHRVATNKETERTPPFHLLQLGTLKANAFDVAWLRSIFATASCTILFLTWCAQRSPRKGRASYLYEMKVQPTVAQRARGIPLHCSWSQAMKCTSTYVKQTCASSVGSVPSMTLCWFKCDDATKLCRCLAQESTIGAAFLTQTVSVNDTTVKFEIWCVLLHEVQINIGKQLVRSLHGPPLHRAPKGKIHHWATEVALKLGFEIKLKHMKRRLVTCC
jgi:hypothetical protein